MLSWRDAQSQVLAQLRAVRARIDERDESGTLALINQQDAFCDAALERRAEVPARGSETRCHFCEGYLQSGGCMSRLDAIDRAVLHAEWEEAARLVDEYQEWVKGLAIPA